MKSWIYISNILTRSKRGKSQKKSTNSWCTTWESPLNSCIITLTLLFTWNCSLESSDISDRLREGYLNVTRATTCHHMKQLLCGILYEKHWIKLLHNKSSTYERLWTVGELNWKQCWIWFLPPLITYWHF